MRGRRRLWSGAVAAVALLTGVLLATSASLAAGTDLRSGRRTQLGELIRAEEREAAAAERTARSLAVEVERRTEAAARGDRRVASARSQVDAVALLAGLAPVRGPGLSVTLMDAPRERPLDHAPDPDGQAPTPDDLVVHEQDVQAVVNALWAGGAEDLALMGQRIVATSAVRCVGNTLLLHGRVYSPPFTVAAIGEPASLTAALDAAPGVQVFRTYVAAYGLGFEVELERDLELPAYDGPLGLDVARVGS